MRNLFLLGASMFFLNIYADGIPSIAYTLNTTDEFILVDSLCVDEQKVDSLAHQIIEEQKQTIEKLDEYIVALNWIVEKKKGRVETESQKEAQIYAYNMKRKELDKPTKSFGNILLNAYTGTSLKVSSNLTKIEREINEGKINKNVVAVIPQCIEIIERDKSERQDYIKRLIEKPEIAWNGTQLPTKTVKVKRNNPYYNMFIPETRNFSKKNMEGWEWAMVAKNKLQLVEKEYPNRVKYYVSNEHPEYGIYENCVYDTNGKLLRAIDYKYNVRGIRDSILKQVLIMDYKNNKYNINKEPAKTQTYIKEYLGLINKELTAKEKKNVDNLAKAWVSELKSTSYRQKEQARRRQKAALLEMFLSSSDDDKGYAYIQQLKNDHKNDFNYCYEMERIDNTSFRLTFMNEEGQSTYSVKVAFLQDGLFNSKIKATVLGEDRTIKKRLIHGWDIENELRRIAEAEKTITTTNDSIFDTVENMPSFRGNVNQWLNQNIIYPTVAKENGIEGKVIVQFVVGKDGSISNVKVTRGVDPSLDKEAVRVVSNMPNWTPGRQNGSSVNVRYTLPVIFKL